MEPPAFDCNPRAFWVNQLETFSWQRGGVGCSFCLLPSQVPSFLPTPEGKGRAQSSSLSSEGKTCGLGEPLCPSVGRSSQHIPGRCGMKKNPPLSLLRLWLCHVCLGAGDVLGWEDGVALRFRWGWMGRRLEPLGLHQSGSQHPNKWRCTLWRASLTLPRWIRKDLGHLCGSWESQWASLIPPWRKKRLLRLPPPTSLCWGCGRAAGEVGGFPLELIEKTAALFHPPSSHTPGPTPSFFLQQDSTTL